MVNIIIILSLSTRKSLARKEADDDYWDTIPVVISLNTGVDLVEMLTGRSSPYQPGDEK